MALEVVQLDINPDSSFVQLKRKLGLQGTDVTPDLIRHRIAELKRAGATLTAEEEETAAAYFDLIAMDDSQIADIQTAAEERLLRLTETGRPKRPSRGKR